MAKSRSLSTTREQKELPLRIAAEREVDGVEMGVLSNGTSYLTIRGLARMCGVDHSVIVRVTDQLLNDPEKPRARQIRELIKGQGGNDGIVFFPVEKNGVLHHTIPDTVCMAILEYYAFEARGGDGQALKAYRRWRGKASETSSMRKSDTTQAAQLMSHGSSIRTACRWSMIMSRLDISVYSKK